MYTFKSLTWALLIGTVAPLTGFASGIDAGGQGVRMTAISAPATSGMADMSDAEVRRIDKSANKITLRHGEIKSLDMPPMTMVFQVKDPAMLGTLKVGDKVKFKAESVNGAMVVTVLAPANES